MKRATPESHAAHVGTDSRLEPACVVLGFDYGHKRIGVAVGQTVTHTAMALTTLDATHGQPDWSQVASLLERWQPQALIVGIPYTDNAVDSPMMAAAGRFARRLHGRYALPVHTVDERLSSHAAASMLGNRPRQPIDAIAAQFIVETWLAHNTVHAHPA